MRWRIYYADGSTFDSSQGPPTAAPALGVVVIVEPDPEVGRHTISSFDYYWRRDGEWYGGDLFGLFDYLIFPGAKCVKFGRTIPNAEFRAIMKRAIEDPDFPRKSAKRKGERC